MYSFKVVLDVCDAITKHLGPEYIHLPRTAEEMQRKVSQFEFKFGMIQAFGYIDGTHVTIKTPSTDSHDYYPGMFIDVDCRWPGCVQGIC